MTEREAKLDALLAEWKHRVLPERFPSIQDVVPETAAAYWQTMRRVWRGDDWRPYVDSCWVARRKRTG